MKLKTMLTAVLGAGSLATMSWAAPPKDRIFLHDEIVPLEGSTRFFLQHVVDEAQDEQAGPWIGVQLAPVPAALAAQLNLGNKGLLVRNVFQGSPADKAGLQRYDVLVKADDAEIVGTVEAFSKTVRGRKAGETVHLTLIRGGKEMKQDLQLAQVPPPDELTTKFPEEPDVLYHKDFGLRGRIFRPGPGGWVMEDLGNIPDFQRLLRDANPWLKEGRERGEHDAVPDHARRVTEKGLVIDVRRLKEGRIEVRREQRVETKAQGPAAEARAEVKTYANMEELRKGDPEAADLLSSLPAPPVPPGPGGSERGSAQRPGRPPLPGEHDRVGKDRERRPVPPPQDERWREWRERFFQGPFETERGERPGRRLDREAPGVRFDVQPDGKITVHKRSGDAEISVTYSNRDEFHQKAPELCRQFEEMQKSLK